MPDTTYHMCGFASGLNWRPVKFMQRLETTRVCRLCGVVPQSIAVLPCAHLMCGSCLDGCASEGGHACPLDKISFVAESDVSWITFHQKHMEKLQVSCWNTHNGCDFVGPAGELLDHFEKRCSFHATRCPRCRDAVLRKDLPRHYEAGCNGVASLQLSVAWHVSSIDVATPNANDEPAVDCSCHDMLTSIQGRVNDLAETLSRLSSRQLQEEVIETDSTTTRGAARGQATDTVHDLTPLPVTADLRALVSALNEMKVVIAEGFRKLERKVRMEDLPAGTSPMQHSQAAVTSRPAEGAQLPPSVLLEMPGSSAGHHNFQSNDAATELIVVSLLYKPCEVAQQLSKGRLFSSAICLGKEYTGVSVRCYMRGNASFVAVVVAVSKPENWKVRVVRPLRVEDLSSPYLRMWMPAEVSEVPYGFRDVLSEPPETKLWCLLDTITLARKMIPHGGFQIDFSVELERCVSL
ncbi:uncharacterized protein [Dermacentor albipictus]|uniref:uncharacterized protein isoform X1 n=2 Tax=Dermacentor albipictus TaxID=60249 RepID=UPI0031FD2409